MFHLLLFLSLFLVVHFLVLSLLLLCVWSVLRLSLRDARDERRSAQLGQFTEGHESTHTPLDRRGVGDITRAPEGTFIMSMSVLRDRMSPIFVLGLFVASFLSLTVSAGSVLIEEQLSTLSGFEQPTSLIIDEIHQTLYVASIGSSNTQIDVFNLTDSTNLTAIQTLPIGLPTQTIPIIQIDERQLYVRKHKKNKTRVCATRSICAAVVVLSLVSLCFLCTRLGDSPVVDFFCSLTSCLSVFRSQVAMVRSYISFHSSMGLCE